jgi:hypothetical protein
LGKGLIEIESDDIDEIIVTSIEHRTGIEPTKKGLTAKSYRSLKYPGSGEVFVPATFRY